MLSVLLLQFAKFSCVHHNRARFRNVLMYSVGSVKSSHSVRIGFLYPNCEQRNKTYQDSQSDPSFFNDILTEGMLFNKILLETLRFATYRDKLSDFNDSFMMPSCLMTRQRTDLIKN